MKYLNSLTAIRLFLAGGLIGFLTRLNGFEGSKNSSRTAKVKTEDPRLISLWMVPALTYCSRLSLFSVISFGVRS